MITHQKNIIQKTQKKALEILGFNVRDPQGAKIFFCIHTLSKEEMWIPKNELLSDALTVLFGPTKLRFIFFESVYNNLPKYQQYPSDQN